MRFTLGTTIGLAVGVATAPLLAATPGLGPLVKKAQLRATELIGSQTALDATATAVSSDADRRGARRCRHRERGTDRIDRTTARTGIVSLAAITGLGPTEADGAGVEQAPAPSDRAALPELSARSAVGADGDALDADAPSSHTDRGGVPPRSSATRATGGDAVDAAELERRVGVLDRLFATYDRVDEE